MGALVPSRDFSTVKLKTFSFRTPRPLYALHRFLFRATNGRWNDTISSLLGVVNPKYPTVDTSTSMFKFTSQDIQKTVGKLHTDGFCVLDQKVPGEVLDRLVELSQTTPLTYLLPVNDYRTDGSQMSKDKDLLKNLLGKSTMFKIPLQDLVRSRDIQSIVTDPLLLSIAQEYLDSKPILSSLNTWWSYPVKDAERFTAAAAQEYHFDMDHFKFFNFFVYLNDVGPNNGPHCYVKGSHRRLPSQFRQRGRFSDKDVAEYYKDNMMELTGPRGTIIAANTRGLHKGKLVTEDARLMIQLNFTNSLFGEQHPQAPFENMEPNRRAFVDKYYQSYFKYL